MAVIPGVNYPGQKYFPEPVVHGAVVATQAGLATAGGGVPTVTLLAPPGTAATVTLQVGSDQAGSFLLTTGTQAPLGGTQCSVVFATPLPTAPASVNVTAANTTASATTQPAIGAGSFTTTGFTVFSAAFAASSTYLISYQVLRQT